MATSWSKPENGYVKVNCKGFYSRAKRSDVIGCLIRDNTGAFVRAVEWKIGMADPKTVEFWALFHGLKLAWEKGEKKVVVESECEEAVADANNPNPFDPMFLLHQMINSLVCEHWDDCKVVAIEATANNAATTLAEHGLDGENGVHVLTEAPAAINTIINQEL